VVRRADTITTSSQLHPDLAEASTEVRAKALCTGLLLRGRGRRRSGDLALFRCPQADFVVSPGAASSVKCWSGGQAGFGGTGRYALDAGCLAGSSLDGVLLDAPNGVAEGSAETVSQGCHDTQEHGARRT
jgi:hypothetical protein